VKRFMFFCVSAFWGSVLSIWTFAVLAGSEVPDAADRVVTLDELARHASADDCWMAIDGVVYDFTDYLPLHPTPPVVMTPWCGKEASEAYHTKGYGRPHSPAADAMLPESRVGTLAEFAD
jgi:cytochrome b involved in lipid metabolism